MGSKKLFHDSPFPTPPLQSILIRHTLPKMKFSRVWAAYIRRSDDVFSRRFFGRRRFFRRFGIGAAGGGETLFRQIRIRILVERLRFDQIVLGDVGFRRALLGLSDRVMEVVFPEHTVKARAIEA